MKTLRCFYTKDFWNWHEVHGLLGARDLGERVELSARDRPYNVRYQKTLQNSDYDVSHGKETEAFCNFEKYF